MSPSTWNLRLKWPTPFKNADFDQFIIYFIMKIVQQYTYTKKEKND